MVLFVCNREINHSCCSSTSNRTQYSTRFCCWYRLSVDLVPFVPIKPMHAMHNSYQLVFNLLFSFFVKKLYSIFRLFLVLVEFTRTIFGYFSGLNGGWRSSVSINIVINFKETKFSRFRINFVVRKVIKPKNFLTFFLCRFFLAQNVLIFGVL